MPVDDDMHMVLKHNQGIRLMIMKNWLLLGICGLCLMATFVFTGY